VRSRGCGLVSWSKNAPRVTQRLVMILQDAGIKLTSVASTLLAKCGRAILVALLAGQTDPDTVADLARGRLRSKIPALREVVAGTSAPTTMACLSPGCWPTSTSSMPPSSVDAALTETAAPRPSGNTAGWVECGHGMALRRLPQGLPRGAPGASLASSADEGTRCCPQGAAWSGCAQSTGCHISLSVQDRPTTARHVTFGPPPRDGQGGFSSISRKAPISARTARSRRRTTSRSFGLILDGQGHHPVIISTLYLPETTVSILYQCVLLSSVCAGQTHCSDMTGTVR
jgi:hypothetical protein